MGQYGLDSLPYGATKGCGNPRESAWALLSSLFEASPGELLAHIRLFV
jgi:hypothetical protein